MCTVSYRQGAEKEMHSDMSDKFEIDRWPVYGVVNLSFENRQVEYPLKCMLQIRIGICKSWCKINWVSAWVAPVRSELGIVVVTILQQNKLILVIIRRGCCPGIEN